MLNLVVLIGFAVAMLGIGWLARSRVSDVEDFVVAGRRLGLPLATSTVLATWFGAGTLLVAADEHVAREFVEPREPCHVGADLVAGSLIKNPGGTLAPSGGYVAGNADLPRRRTID